MKCIIYCLADYIDLTCLTKYLRSTTPIITIKKHWQCLEVISQSSLTCYIFANGALVSWNVEEAILHTLLTAITQLSSDKLEKPLSDTLNYQYGEKTSIMSLTNLNTECITLENKDQEIKLALSYGLAQSIKLKLYEERLEKLFQKYGPLATQMANQGYLNLSRKQTKKMVGEILEAKVVLNLSSGFLYQPKFFWQHPNLEKYYELIEQYMDISVRTDILNNQLNTLNEIFMMLNETLESNHSHRLEIIIIILISFEVIYSILHW